MPFPVFFGGDCSLNSTTHGQLPPALHRFRWLRLAHARSTQVPLVFPSLFCYRSMVVRGLRIASAITPESDRAKPQRIEVEDVFRKTMSRTKIITFIVAAVFFGAMIWWAVPKSSQRENPRSQESLDKLAAEINRGVPVMIDKETELLHAVGTDGMLIYNYRLVSYSVSQLDSDKFAAGAKERITQGACNRPETRDDLLKQGVTLRYSYFDKDKQHIATIDVLPADCG